ncbi:hypothetical protein H5T88_03795 [bacterium]|nr:hypothetical protein [bacterium]
MHGSLPGFAVRAHRWEANLQDAEQLSSYETVLIVTTKGLNIEDNGETGFCFIVQPLRVDLNEFTGLELFVSDLSSAEDNKPMGLLNFYEPASGFKSKISGPRFRPHIVLPSRQQLKDKINNSCLSPLSNWRVVVDLTAKERGSEDSAYCYAIMESAFSEQVRRKKIRDISVVGNRMKLILKNGAEKSCNL